MRKVLERLKNSHPQTKLFIFMSFVYLAALLWTTGLAYFRLTYSPSELVTPVVINIPSEGKK